MQRIFKFQVNEKRPCGGKGDIVSSLVEIDTNIYKSLLEEHTLPLSHLKLNLEATQAYKD